ncbi:MAG: hypothetical protein KBD10_00430 [Candidatus Pacebacteria bacterium]|nr:hypothetical protein [Candidatus Paceibacterota bacterium]
MSIEGKSFRKIAKAQKPQKPLVPGIREIPERKLTSENQKPNIPEDSEFLKHNTDGHCICLECAADL